MQEKTFDILTSPGRRNRSLHALRSQGHGNKAPELNSRRSSRKSYEDLDKASLCVEAQRVKCQERMPSLADLQQTVQLDCMFIAQRGNQTLKPRRCSFVKVKSVVKQDLKRFRAANEEAKEMFQEKKLIEKGSLPNIQKRIDQIKTASRLATPKKSNATKPASKTVKKRPLFSNIKNVKVQYENPQDPYSLAKDSPVIPVELVDEQMTPKYQVPEGFVQLESVSGVKQIVTIKEAKNLLKPDSKQKSRRPGSKLSSSHRSPRQSNRSKRSQNSSRGSINLSPNLNSDLKHLEGVSTPMIGTEEVLTPMLQTDVQFKISTCPASPIFRKVNPSRKRSDNTVGQMSGFKEIIKHRNQ